MELILLIIGFMVVMMFMSSRGRKKQEEQMRQMHAEIETGTWVRTTAGYYGMVTDIDGDVYILQSPSGHETYWDRRAIAMVAEPPFAGDEEGEELFGASTTPATDVIDHEGAEPTFNTEAYDPVDVQDHADDLTSKDAFVADESNTDVKPGEGADLPTVDVDEESDLRDSEDLWDDSFTTRNDPTDSESKN